MSQDIVIVTFKLNLSKKILVLNIMNNFYYHGCRPPFRTHKVKEIKVINIVTTGGKNPHMW